MFTLPAEEMETFAELIEVEPRRLQPSFDLVPDRPLASGQACEELAQPFVPLAQVIDDDAASAIGVGVAIPPRQTAAVTARSRVKVSPRSVTPRARTRKW